LGCSIIAFPTVLDRRVTAKDETLARTILEDHVQLMIQSLYPECGTMYQLDNAPIHTARLMTEWFDKHESGAECEAILQSPMACTVDRSKYV